MAFAYPAKLVRDEDDRVLVTFRDIPWAATDGVDEREARFMAIDCLSVALRHLMGRGEAIPRPTRRRRGEVLVAPDPTVVMKLAVIEGSKSVSAPAATLARALGVDHKEARRILDPAEPTKDRRLGQALSVFGLMAETSITAVANDRTRARRKPRAA